MSVFKTRNFIPMSQTALESIDMGMVDIMPTMNVQPVHEGYVGKTKNLTKIEELFGVMQRRYPTESIIEKSSKDLHDSVEKMQIEKLICEEFGFKSATISISTLKTTNAFTVPISVLQRDITTGMPKGLTAHGEKYYDVSHQYDFFVRIYTENFRILTPGELTAMLLHEIGHCFDVCTMTYVADVFNWILCIAKGPVGIFGNYFSNKIAKYLYKFIDAIESITPVSVLAHAGLSVIDMINMIGGPYGSLTFMGRMLAGAILNPGDTIRNITVGVGEEKFADSFATAYGYGPETISLQDKLDTEFITRDKNFIFDTWTWMGSIAPTIMSLICDGHPEAQTRARMALDDLRKLSESPDLPKHLRVSVKRDFVNAKEAYDLFVQVEPDKRNSIALRFSRGLKENMLSGKLDFRTYFFTTSAIQAGYHRSR